jgi:hypothetical protein
MSTDQMSQSAETTEGFAAAVYQWVSDWGELVVEAIYSIGDLTRFILTTFSWMLIRFPGRATLLPNFYQVGVRSLPVIALDGDVYWHGSGGAELLSVPSVGAGDSAGSGHQHVAGARTGACLGRHDAGRACWRRDGRRIGDDARDGTD